MAGLPLQVQMPVYEHGMPDDDARLCTHTADCASVGGAVQVPPTLLHAVLQLPDLEDRSQRRPVCPQEMSASGGKGGAKGGRCGGNGGEGGGGCGARPGGQGGGDGGGGCGGDGAIPQPIATFATAASPV